MSEYAFGLDEDTTVFRLRCARGDLERCTLWYGDTSSPETPVPVYPAEMTVLEACFHSENPALKAIAEYERAIEEPSGEGLQEAMARMDALEAWDYEQRAKRILSRLKIRDFGQRVGTLSGGQLKRVALANVLISESDLLILDEPTNHLDTDMTEWLEEYLAASGAGLLMVTHDRYFLDKVCSDILEIEDRQL